MKTTISRSEYLQLVGLLTLAEHHNSALHDIERAAADLLGEARNPNLSSDYFGHVTDAVFGEFDVNTLLYKAGITVAGGLPGQGTEGDAHGT